MLTLNVPSSTFLSRGWKLAFSMFLTRRIQTRCLRHLTVGERRSRTLDLIRNHLYSYFADPDEKKRRAIVHQNLENTLSALSMTRNSKQAREYFRCFFQCEYGFLQEQRFYRATRASIRTSAGKVGGEYVYRIVEDLGNPASVELFRSISASTPNRDLIEAFCNASRTSNDRRNLTVFSC